MNAQTPGRPRKPSTSGAPPILSSGSSRRLLKYVIILAFVFSTIFFLSSPTKREVVTDLRFFHHTPTHRPEPQKNSTSGDIHWYSDLKWLNPFSSSITFDEYRSVLPPLRTRPPIYTFYDGAAEKDEKVRAEENKLLLIWRRAWWAQGLRPVVLGPSEAAKHPLYASVKAKKPNAQLESDVLRWLAWGQMGSGILANWLCVPLSVRDDKLLTQLRSGRYSKLTVFDGLGSGLLTGDQEAINGALKDALDSPKFGDSKALIDILSINAEFKPASIGFYDANAVAERYKPVSNKLAENKPEGLASLAELILSHLHLTFRNRFPDGFAVLTPFPSKTHLVTHAAYSLANALRDCPKSPMQDSCPLNQPSCKPCSPSTAPPILTPEAYANSSSTYTIGTLPHPYTLASLLSRTRDITTRHIRRDTKRDRWIGAVTDKTLGEKLGGPSRLVGFKDAVAGDIGTARSFWMIDGQEPARKDIEYHFGFTLPTFNVSEASLPPIPNMSLGLEGSKREKKSREKDVKLQKDLLEDAQELVRHKTKKKSKGGVKEMVEAWNLADTEAWRFVRAFRARERVVREKWEQEERRFAGGEEGEGGWQWFDKRKQGR